MRAVHAIAGRSFRGSFFLDEGFLREAPTRHERHRDMMMPSVPVANLIVRQTRLALRVQQNLLNRASSIVCPNFDTRVNSFASTVASTVASAFVK